MWYDIIILVILVYATIKGAVKGIVWQLATISALVGCFLFAETGSTKIASSIPVQAPLNKWIAMAILYIGLSFVCFYLAKQLKGLIEKAKFQEYDRHLGGILGFLKGVLFSMVLTFFLVTLSASMREMILQTKSGHYAALIMDRLHPVMPEELGKLIEPYIHQLDQPGMDLKHQHEGSLAHPELSDQNSSNNPFEDNPFQPSSTSPYETDDNPYKVPPFDVRVPGTNINLNVDSDLNVQPGLVPNSTSHPGSAPLPTFGNDNTSHGSPFYDSNRNLQPPVKLTPQAERLWPYVRDAFQKMTPQQKDQFIQQLRQLSDADVNQLIDKWRERNPYAGPTPRLPAIPEQRARYTQEIASLLTDSSGAQKAIIQEIEAALIGIPDQVSLRVIEDWHFDLKSIGNTDGDPDPTTSIKTPLDSRILSQLKRANISVHTLSQGLQDRLIR